MVTGKEKNCNKYYEGYEPEPEYIFTIGDTKYHIWDGYIDDILDEPYAFQVEWKGFTRDYQLQKGIWGVDIEKQKLEPKEYLTDLLHYKDNDYCFPRSKEVFDLLVSLLTRAINENLDVFIELI